MQQYNLLTRGRLCERETHAALADLNRFGRQRFRQFGNERSRKRLRHDIFSMNRQDIAGPSNTQDDAIGKLQIRFFAQILNRTHQITGVAFELKFRRDRGGERHHNAAFRFHSQALFADKLNLHFVC